MKSLIGVRALKDGLLIDIFDRGDKTVRGVIIPDDHFSRERGIRPRSALVLSAGPLVEKDGIFAGDIVYIDKMEWSRKLGVYPAVDGRGDHGVWWTRLDKVLFKADKAHG
jgi:hypothetical protein